MAAISSSKHEKLIAFVQVKMDREELSREALENVQLLCGIHTRYQEQLTGLRALIAEYEALQKQLRKQLRKQGRQAKEPRKLYSEKGFERVLSV